MGPGDGSLCRLEQEDRVARVVLASGKANALDPPLLEALLGALAAAEERQCTGLVLVGSGRFFCAGLNLPVVMGFDRPAMASLMGLFREALLRILRFPGRTVAAINGHAVAGGAVLACACDVRVAVRGDLRIGVSDVAMGLGLPRVALEVLRRALGEEQLLEVVLSGSVYPPEEARGVGLVHELVEPDTLLPFALARAGRFAHAPFTTLRQVKREIVAPAVERVLRGDEDREWLDTWFSEEARRVLAAVVARLEG